MTDHVWLCSIMNHGVVTGGMEDDLSQKDVELAIQAQKLNNKGQPVPREMCPTRIWSGEHGLPFKNIVDLFPSGSHLIVSARAADIMRQYDLGGGALYPVSEGVYQKDNKTRIPGGEFFTWIFGNTKTAFLEQHSPKAEAMGPGGRGWCDFANAKDNDIAVSKAAERGPDVWVDPILFKSIFLSAALGNALVAGGMKTSMRLLRCRVL